MTTFMQAATSHDAQTVNGAVSHSTSGSSILDYFYKVGSYRGRSQEAVNADMGSIFGEDERLALKVVLYNRLITRRPHGQDIVARGQGNRDEFIKSLNWLRVNRAHLYDRIVPLLPVFGCWKDMWYDSPVTNAYHYVDPSVVATAIRYLSSHSKEHDNLYHLQMIAKYLPRPKSASNRKNERHARQQNWISQLRFILGWSGNQYRKFKSNPNFTAHNWQRQMSANQWDKIDFNTIPGKALTNLVSGKALSKHNIEAQYLKWIQSKPVANFTGYVYELYKKADTRKRNAVQTHTYNAQFNKLLEVACKDVNPDLLNAGVLCALDTSGSMQLAAADNATAFDICVSLGIFFSSLINGHFANHVLMFDDKSRFLKLQGTFCDKVDKINNANVAWGSTNFQSCIDEIVRVRKENPNVPIEEYPKVLLVVSDMQFNPVLSSKTNEEEAQNKLAQVGLPPMTFIWWQVNASYGKDVPSKMDTPGTVLISGFDGSIVTTILGGKEKKTSDGQTQLSTPYEQMLSVLSQPIFELLNR